MFLKKVSVHDFRVLKDIELNYSPEFTPSIYPLGSINGGGKSTLLQLIFTLLHCSFNESRYKYLVNILSLINPKMNGETKLANFEIEHNKENFSIEFILHDNIFDHTSFNCFLDISDIEEKITQTRKIENIYSSVKSIKQRIQEQNRISPIMQRELRDLIDQYIHYTNDKELASSFRFLRREVMPNGDNELEAYNSSIRHILTNFEKTNQIDLDEIRDTTLNKINTLKETLSKENLTYITHIDGNRVILYKTTAEKSLLQSLSEKIYLATPSTQILLFLSNDDKKSLFSTESYTNYYSAINEAKKTLNGLFTYDFASTSAIVNAFQIARDQDFKEALQSNDYGDNLKKLKKDLHDFLSGKIITVAPDFSRVIFKIENNNAELFPEDLSHGELKKLGIYIWLKSCDIKNSLVLMDEVEIGMHPDWQYEIINELQEWSEDNQFILATHSYELCQAVTPSHVSELEPKLIKQ